MRGDLAGDPDFRALLGRVREATLGAFAHQEVPFERLVEELHPERSLSHAPVFQVMFALQNVPEEPAEGFPGLEASGIAYERDTAHFDLTLSFDPAPGGALAGTLEYATDLFEAETITRLTNQYLMLLASALREPSAPVFALPLLGAAERGEILRLSAGADAAFDRTRTVADRFSAVAATCSDAVAIEMDESALTYGVLEARSNRAARLLRARGVGPETPVALVMERSPESVLAFVATVKAGGFVVPIDPEFPAERLGWMLEDSDARIVLTQERWIDRLPADLDVMALDAPDVLDGFDDAAVEGAPPPEALAYLIYTSGSTGTPKGVGVPHGNLAAYADLAAAQFGVTAADRVLHRTATAFDPAVSEIWLALTTGATLVAAPAAAHADPPALARLVADARVTVVDVVPTLLAALLDESAFVEAAPRLVFCGGEALPPALARRAVALLPRTRIVNAYGPTETTITATAWEVEGGAPVAIGPPTFNVRAYVMDARGEPCPVGVPGELFVGGALVARGYWRRPALTAERFVPDPFAGEAGERMYRTGDRARWTNAGVLEYLGRLDLQVKVRGMRIEPQEIEAALLADPAVREAVVVARRNAAGSDVLAAYVVAALGGVAVDALRDGLRRRLPAHLVPGAIVALDALPLTANGKVDRRALPDPESAGGGAYVPPFTPAEIEMAGVWREVLGVERVGAGDDFFALGGHSLLAVRLVARVRERFGREVPLAELFRSPTLSAFAEAVAAGESRAASPLVALGTGGTLPPLFFVHPAGGTVFRYADLARRLEPEQPFFGLQARGVSDDQPAIDEMEEMVDHYLSAIRAAFAEGP
ncbi:MAG TPA: amino acid adenylation domain-containing protein, partial [Longimicrobium sp.]|nr:amino acid adenylation domain-containing protein [Longimicrobium sp.]